VDHQRPQSDLHIRRKRIGVDLSHEGASCMVATGTFPVVVGALLAAIDAAVLLRALVGIHDANTVATSTLHHFYCICSRAHRLHPLFAMIRSRIGSCGDDGKSEGRLVVKSQYLSYLFTGEVAKAGAPD
jgi:hypothetical protein